MSVFVFCVTTKMCNNKKVNFFFCSLLFVRLFDGLVWPLWLAEMLMPYVLGLYLYKLLFDSIYVRELRLAQVVRVRYAV